MTTPRITSPASVPPTPGDASPGRDSHAPAGASSWFERIAASRKPDFVIGDSYLERWWIIPRNPIFNIYLHRFWHSDEDRALHDHPWINLSIVLRGFYLEHTICAGGICKVQRYSAGSLKFRLPWSAHRIEITEPPVYSLFITGPVIRTWGFHCPQGWRPWKVFVDERDSGKVGRGCE